MATLSIVAADDSHDPQRVEIRPELAARFKAEFDACLALYWFGREHRPPRSPIGGAAGEIILWTYARSSATFQASFRLTAAGYGIQAGMLNRSLWEDMLIAHWVKRHPDEAPQKLADHERYVLVRWGRHLRNYDLLPGVEFPTMTKAERRAADQRYRGKTWTGLSLNEILMDVRGEWQSELDRRLLHQNADIVNGFNNTLLHHNARALGLVGRYDEERHATTMVAGPSDTHIAGALGGAFFSYGNTTSLVLRGDDLAEFEALYSEHLSAFVTTRPFTPE